MATPEDATTVGDESSPDSAAALYQARLRMRERRRHRALTWLRILTGPALIAAGAAAIALILGAGSSRKVVPGLIVLLLVVAVPLWLTTVKSRLRRSRRLAIEVALLESTVGRLGAEVERRADPENARGAVSLVSAGEGEPGGLSLPDVQPNTAAADSPAPLRLVDRLQIFADAGRDRLVVLGWGVCGVVGLLLIVGLTEPGHLGIAAALFGIAILLPILLAIGPALLGQLRLVTRLREGRLSTGGANSGQPMLTVEASDGSRTVARLPWAADAARRGVLARSDDRELVAIQLGDGRWEAEYRVLE